MRQVLVDHSRRKLAGSVALALSNVQYRRLREIPGETTENPILDMMTPVKPQLCQKKRRNLEQYGGVPVLFADRPHGPKENRHTHSANRQNCRARLGPGAGAYLADFLDS